MEDAAAKARVRAGAAAMPNRASMDGTRLMSAQSFGGMA